MLVRGKHFMNVVICRIKNKDKFFIKKGNTFYYLKKGRWKKVVGTDEQLATIPFYRFSAYNNKKFLPHKEVFFDFITYTFT